MAIALVVNTAKQSTDSNAITTNAIDTTGSTLLIVAVSEDATAGGATPSDSKTNTWVKAGTATYTGSDITTIWYVKNPTVGTSHTFTGGKASNFPSIFVMAFSGTDTTQNRDQENSTGGSVPVTTRQTGSVTPTTNNQVLVTSLTGATASTTYSIDSGFTITNQFSVIASIAYAGAFAYKIQTTAGAENPTWTATNADNLAVAIDTFKAKANSNFLIFMT